MTAVDMQAARSALPGFTTAPVPRRQAAELTAVFYGRTHIPAWSPAAGSGCAARSASGTTAAPR